MLFPDQTDNSSRGDDSIAARIASQHPHAAWAVIWDILSQGAVEKIEPPEIRELALAETHASG